MFSVDLCTYDHIFPENPTTTKLQETVLLFASIVNSRFFKRTSTIFFFCNVKRFEEKTHHSPLSNHFPDYTGGNDINRATKFLLWRFIQVNRANLPTHPQLVLEDSGPNHALILHKSPHDTSPAMFRLLARGERGTTSLSYVSTTVCSLSL
ncbi:G-protein alpha subunit-domain-containing protein [Tricladium varicosporioides]|nr:G-protein alpha subunit-domain-containing protein [Hymenoscyphus varicosporioides]